MKRIMKLKIDHWITMTLLLIGLTINSAGGLLGNEGFEQELNGSDQGNWVIWGGAERLNWQVYEGGYSLCCKGNWCGLDYAGGEQKITINDQSIYNLTFMQYFDNGFTAGQVDLVVDWRDANGNVLEVETFALSLNYAENQWNLIGPFELSPASGAVEAEIRFVLGWTGVGGAYYVDQVIVTEEQVAPPPPVVSDFFHCDNGEILDSEGNPFLIRGIAASGWLMAEGYMWQLYGSDHLNSPSQLSEQIESIVGEQNAATFWQLYRENFMTDADLDFLLSQGLNTIRLPFNYRMLSPEDQEGVFLEEGFQLLDQAIQKLKAKGINIILDMHGVPGGSSAVGSGDPEHTFWVNMGDWWQEYGVACLWKFDQGYYEATGRTPESNQARTAAVWAEIAERYADEAAIIGYELINEPNLPEPKDTQMLRDTLIEITTAIRAVDQNHIIFVEGDNYSESIDGLLPAWDSNMAIAFHTYWKENNLAQIQGYLDARSQHGIPLWCSESGENSNPWAYEFVQLLEEYNIGWSWWGWKKINGYASGLSAQTSVAQQYVVNKLWNENTDPVQFMDGLLDIAVNMHTDVCDYKPGFFEALFDPSGDFGQNSQPFAVHTLPGTIDCVDYDIGNQNVAYHDTVYKNEVYRGEDGNCGLTYRSDGVDILTCSDGCGYKVAYTDAGEWLNYTVDIESSERFKIYARITSGVSESKIKMYLDGKAIISDVALPNTGGWDNWETVYLGRVRLKSGTHVLKIQFVEGGADLSQIIVSR